MPDISGKHERAQKKADEMCEKYTLFLWQFIKHPNHLS